MNSNSQSPYAIAGEELLHGNLEPSCYARALAEANGDPERARAVYAKLRVSDLGTGGDYKTFDRSGLPKFEAAKRLPKKVEDDLLSPIILTLITLVGYVGTLGTFYGKKFGELTMAASLEVVVAAICLTLASVVLCVAASFYVKKLKAIHLFVLLATVSALGSLGGTVLMVRSHGQVSWNPEPMESVEVPAVLAMGGQR